MADISQSREIQPDQPALLTGLQHLEVPQLVHGSLVDEVELPVLPLTAALRLHVQPDRKSERGDLLEGETPPEEVLVDNGLSAVVHKLHLDMRGKGGVQDGGSVPE